MRKRRGKREEGKEKNGKKDEIQRGENEFEKGNTK